jgi:uncharacterized membrane protein YgcG
MMKNTKRFLQIIAMILLVTSTGFAQIQVPQPHGLINDFAGKLSVATKQSLENQLKDFNFKHRIEVAVVTIPFEKLKNYTIENYTRELAQVWKNNSGHTNLQVVLLIAIKDVETDGEYHGSTRLDVDGSLKSVIPDALASEIIKGMREDFKTGQFDIALTKGVQSTVSALSKSYGALPESSSKRISNPPNSTAVVASPSGSNSSTRYPSANHNVTSNDSSWPFPAIFLFALGIPFLLLNAIIFFMFRTLGKFGGSKQPYNQAIHSESSAYNSSNTNYQDSSSYSNWRDTTSSSSSSDSGTGTSYIDAGSSSNYSDSSSNSSYSDSSSSPSFSDSSSSSSSSDSSSSSSGGATDNW